MADFVRHSICIIYSATDYELIDSAFLIDGVAAIADCTYWGATGSVRDCIAVWTAFSASLHVLWYLKHKKGNDRYVCQWVLARALPSPTAWRKKESRIDYSGRDPIQRRSVRDAWGERGSVPLTPLDRAFLPSRLSFTSFSLIVFPSIELSNPLRAWIHVRARRNTRIKTPAFVSTEMFSQFIFESERFKLASSRFIPNSLYKLPESPATFRTYDAKFHEIRS